MSSVPCTLFSSTSRLKTKLLTLLAGKAKFIHSSQLPDCWMMIKPPCPSLLHCIKRETGNHLRKASALTVKISLPSTEKLRPGNRISNSWFLSSNDLALLVSSIREKSWTGRLYIVWSVYQFHLIATSIAFPLFPDKRKFFISSPFKIVWNELTIQAGQQQCGYNETFV